MTTPDKAFQAALLETTKQSSSEYELGRAAGREEARRELLPEMTKISAEAATALLADVQDREEFRGQVVVHSAVSALGRFKQSMAAGRCWQCGVREPSAVSTYRRCSQCDANDP